jgi:hypothetical protein
MFNQQIIEHTGIVLENLQDTNQLVQLGQIQGLISSIEQIISDHSDSGIIKNYGSQLIIKLKTIYQYRWDSSNDPTKNIKFGKNRSLYLTESPYSILNKAKEFVAMYNNTSSVNNSVIGDITGGNNKELIKQQFEKLSKEGSRKIEEYDSVVDELENIKVPNELKGIKKQLDKKLKVLGKHKYKIIAISTGGVITAATLGLLAAAVGALTIGLAAVVGSGGLKVLFNQKQSSSGDSEEYLLQQKYNDKFNNFKGLRGMYGSKVSDEINRKVDKLLVEAEVFKNNKEYRKGIGNIDTAMAYLGLIPVD